MLIPQFDATCGVSHGAVPDSSEPAINSGPNFGCPNPINTSSHGQDNWYRMPSFAYFQLCSSSDPDCAAAGTNYGAYIQGHNAICDTGNGATSCLVGKFVSIMGTGTVGPGVGGGIGGNKAVGIQLIK